ncbi:hypothetical protein HMPREF1986_02248 [Oribacterium sp. oral taxon 078 str. F0263]|uniref:hypothetical protein n=1 Tax=Oribacterium sp. oral taxon 078 TaxID=652706 RepID=UPI0003ADB4CD|nr:hypothetical protein [Oribacterium sp. oral taxon 078]ERL19791.1 hypothetical protein HMPREF1986_02248 [Oribacterium sp. oral taxon 078 str. F0263]
MKLTELQIPDLKTMAAGRKAAEMARELKELNKLKRKTSLLVSALRAAVDDRNTALGRAILWRWIAALECIAILSLSVLWMISA